jgi:xanthine/CO dehydrogenase XdhC/CoxF family maturation factor
LCSEQVWKIRVKHISSWLARRCAGLLSRAADAQSNSIVEYRGRAPREAAASMVTRSTDFFFTSCLGCLLPHRVSTPHSTRARDLGADRKVRLPENSGLSALEESYPETGR